MLVNRLEEEARYGHIIIPDTAKEKSQQGKVIAVGTGKRTEEGKTLPLDPRPVARPKGAVAIPLRSRPFGP